MTQTWTILYPSEAVFDYLYYTTKHMAMFEEAAGPRLLDWRVAKIKADDAPFQVQATFVFTSADDFKDVMASSWGKKLHTDIENFSNMTPLMMEQTEVVSKNQVK